VSFGATTRSSFCYEIKSGKGVREARRAEAKWVEVRREAAAYRRWRNRPEKLAGTAESGEKSGQPGGVSGEIGRGETQRGSRAIYRCVARGRNGKG
jgi:hypothetical protein